MQLHPVPHIFGANLSFDYFTSYIFQEFYINNIIWYESHALSLATTKSALLHITYHTHYIMKKINIVSLGQIMFKYSFCSL